MSPSSSAASPATVLLPLCVCMIFIHVYWCRLWLLRAYPSATGERGEINTVLSPTHLFCTVGSGVRGGIKTTTQHHPPPYRL